MPDVNQELLGELRALRRDYNEIALSLRLDTGWNRLREQVGYALVILRDIPPLVRASVVASILALTYGAVYRQAKAIALGVNLLVATLLLVGTAV